MSDVVEFAKALRYVCKAAYWDLVGEVGNTEEGIVVAIYNESAIK
jgi:hypothetical protein